MGTTCHALITAPGANMVPERCGLAPDHSGECQSEAAVLRQRLTELEAKMKTEAAIVDSKLASLEKEVTKAAAKNVAKWIKGPVAASMFGSTTWSTRQGIARCIEDGTWNDQEINREDCGPG